ncbi:MAG TPA: nuclear transport factor 2 family protein [Kofleriaceae bacterium]|jgi:hypothetical protein|nr:nuclear transport factor 2 family protein [Kofleriaceae bacterium]
MRRVVLATLLVVPTVTIAAPADDVTELLEALPARDTDGANPAFSFTNDNPYWRGKDQFANQPNFMAMGVDIKKLVVATSADGKTAWLAADVKGVPQDGECAPGPCPPNRDPALHVSGVIEQTGKGWSWLAWHVAAPVTGKHQAAIVKQAVMPDAIPRAITGAEGVVALFETTILESRTLAGTVSDRKDVVLYGSESAERYVTGAKVKAQLTKWQLGFAVRDGVQAGLSANKQVAWVAANVDARSLKRPKDKPLPYRVLFVYEKAGDAWKLVLLHFSVDTFTYQKP